MRAELQQRERLARVHLAIEPGLMLALVAHCEPLVFETEKMLRPFAVFQIDSNVIDHVAAGSGDVLAQRQTGITAIQPDRADHAGLREILSRNRAINNS